MQAQTTATNKDIIALAFADMAKGDSARYIAALSENIRYELVGENSWGRIYEGRAEFLSQLGGPLISRIQRPLVMKATRIFEDGDHVILEAVGENRTLDGRPYLNRYCMIMRMEEGKVVELTEYTDTDLILRLLGERV